MRTWKMSSFHSGKFRQLQIFWRPDWRGFIVYKQPVSLAAHFHSASIAFLSQGFAEKHRKKDTNTKQQHQAQSLLFPPAAVSHLGLAPELAQTLGIPKSSLQIAVTPDPWPPKIGHWHIIDVHSSITTVQKVQQG